MVREPQGKPETGIRLDYQQSIYMVTEGGRGTECQGKCWGEMVLGESSSRRRGNVLKLGEADDESGAAIELSGWRLSTQRARD
jgi:hypothetical protein